MEKKFKCKDEVIIKSKKYSTFCYENVWAFGVFSHYVKDKEIEAELAVINGYAYNTDLYDILPYVGNEHLVGTTDSPDEEIRLEKEELLVVSDHIGNFMVKVNAYNLQAFHHLNIDCFECCNGHVWRYAIRLKDFDPSNMEKTRKKILCVKNGKVVKYKG